MDFAKQFDEAAQKAVLVAVETGSWTRFPWIETLMKKSVRTALTAEVTISSDSTISPLHKLIEQHPLDICGCPTGFCTCNSTVITEDPPCEAFHQRTKKVDDSFESNDFNHVEGYDWRIIVTDRSKNHRNSWAEHFNHEPTQDEFELQFRHFHARTHYVHVNQWVDGNWITITENYVPAWRKEKPEETFTATEEWPEGKSHRIRFFDQRVGRYNYVYFGYKPGGMILNKYHSTKCFAVVQERPEGI